MGRKEVAARPKHSALMAAMPRPLHQKHQQEGSRQLLDSATIHLEICHKEFQSGMSPRSSAGAQLGISMIKKCASWLPISRSNSLHFRIDRKFTLSMPAGPFTTRR